MGFVGLFEQLTRFMIPENEIEVMQRHIEPSGESLHSLLYLQVPPPREAFGYTFNDTEPL